MSGVDAIDWHDHRRRIGRLGEDLAAAFLQRRGARIVFRNVAIGRGEVDIVAQIGTTRTAVEVKTAVGPDARPADAFDEAKARQVRSLARCLDPPARRVDLVTVVLDHAGATIRWSPFAG